MAESTHNLYRVIHPFEHEGQQVTSVVRLTPGEAALLQRQGTVGEQLPELDPDLEKEAAKPAKPTAKPRKPSAAKS